MTPQQIKSRLREMHLSQEDLARRFGKSRTTIHFLIAGRLKSERLEKRLARTLGVTVEELRNGSTDASTGASS